jgi:hypothetical protein
MPKLSCSCQFDIRAVINISQECGAGGDDTDGNSALPFEAGVVPLNHTSSPLFSVWVPGTEVPACCLNLVVVKQL